MSKQGQGGGSSSGGHMRNTATASGAGAAATGSVPLPLPMPVAIRPGGGAAAVVDLAADSDADADSDSDIRVGATTGFANIGNTCYLSALLQVSCPIHPTQRNASENCSSEFLNTVSLLDAANFCFVLLFGELRTVRSASSTPQSFCSGWTGAGGTGWALVGSSIKYMLAGV